MVTQAIWPFMSKFMGPPCKGLVYRYRHNYYQQNDGAFVEKMTVRLLKKASCRMCHQCKIDEECVKQYMLDDSYLPEMPADISDCDLIRPVFSGSGPDINGEYESELHFVMAKHT